MAGIESSETDDEDLIRIRRYVTMENLGVLGIVAHLTKGSKMPADVVNGHVLKLQNSVGLTCGKVHEISNRHLQDLATRVQNSADFIARYKEAAGQNCLNLASMLEILHDVGGNETTKAYLAQKAAFRGETGNDYQALKERLLQQVGSRASLETNLAAGSAGVAEGASRPGPFPNRHLLTNDFVLLPDPAQKSEVAGSLGCVPVFSQESALVQDLLYCFVGIGGRHIRPVIKRDSSNTTREHLPRLEFQLDEDVDPTLRALVFKILPLCQHYSTVVRFVEKHSLMGCGRVNQALSAAIVQVVKEFCIFVAELEAQHRRGRLTLNKIWFSIQTKLEVMEMMADLCRVVDKTGSRGGKTLSLLHEVTAEKAASSNDKVRSVGLFLTQRAAEPWFKILTRWVLKGIINDPGKDFFVEDNEVIERSALPLEYSDDYWERRYTIKPDQIPAFLHSNTDKILRTGKYLNVIQQCGDERSSSATASIYHHHHHQHNQATSSANKVFAFDNYEERQHVVGLTTEAAIGWTEREVEDFLHYTENTEEYSAPLEKAYAIASKNLLDLLVKDKDLIGHLRSVKHYFLLDLGDFVVQFFEVCGDELMQSVDHVEPTRLESLLELALRTSVANSDPYKDSVRVELLPYDLIFQMSKILSIDTEAESEFKGPADTADLTGLEAFAFGYDVQWPVSLVLNRKSLACYQMLLRHLLFCKHVEKLISGVWIANKSTKNLPFGSFHAYGPSFALRQKMLNFLQNLEYYMTFEVLEPNWEDMIAKIRSGKVSNVDQVLQIHTDFLTTCLNDCLLSNPSLLTTVKKLLKVCCEFSEYMKAASSGSSSLPFESEETFVEDTAKFDLRFTSVLMSLLDKIAQLARENYNEKILNILHRLDFNGFYSQALDSFRVGAAVASGPQTHCMAMMATTTS